MTERLPPAAIVLATILGAALGLLALRQDPGLFIARARTAPTIVLIPIDTRRLDRLPAWSGRSDLATPAIDRLVHDGLLFERAFA